MDKLQQPIPFIPLFLCLGKKGITKTDKSQQRIQLSSPLKNIFKQFFKKIITDLRLNWYCINLPNSSGFQNFPSSPRSCLFLDIWVMPLCTKPYLGFLNVHYFLHSVRLLQTLSSAFSSHDLPLTSTHFAPVHVHPNHFLKFRDAQLGLTSEILTSNLFQRLSLVTQPQPCLLLALSPDLTLQTTFHEVHVQV